MSRHIPIRPVCARPGCVETKLGLNCYVCHLVRYCSQDCKDQDQPAHQSLCEQHENRARIFSYDVTKDIKELEPEDPRDPYPHCNNEAPAIGDEPRLFSKSKVMSLIGPQDQDGFKDGEEVNIAIYGFGDLGLLIETFLSIRHDTKVKYTFYMEEADNEAAARVFVLLAMAVNGSHYIQVAEAIIHYWYSAFLPDWVMNFLKEKIHPNAINTHRTSLELAATVDNGVGRVQAEMMYPNASTTKGSQVWFTKDFGPGESLLSFTQPLDFLTLDHARLQRSHNINGRASSIQMELVRDQAHPGWRSSRMEHLKTGILLPLTASKAEFKNPNPSFFREWDKSKDYGFNPMEAWEGVYKPDRKYNVPFGDGHGNFFYFMREKLIRFLYAMDHMENWKIIVAPPLVAEGLPSSWNIQWHPEPKGKPIVELHKFNSIEEFRDFQKRHSLDRKQDQDPSSQGTEVEALADGHSGKAAEATQEEQSSPQELQPEKKPSDEKHLTKSEKRKAAIAKKKALKAAKSAAKADKKKNLKPSDRDGPTTQASAPANDATLGSSKATEPESPGVITASSSSEVIFTPPASPGVSETVGLSPHRQPDVTSRREDGEEQEQQEQEPGREGVGSSPLTALQDQLAVPLWKATEDEGSLVPLLKEAGSAGSAVFLPKATEDEGIELPPKTDSEPSVAVPDQTSSKPQPRRAFSNASHPNTLIFSPSKSTTSSLIADIDGNSLTAEVMSRNLPQNARRRTSSAPLYGDRNPWDIWDENRRRVNPPIDRTASTAAAPRTSQPNRPWAIAGPSRPLWSIKRRRSTSQTREPLAESDPVSRPVMNLPVWTPCESIARERDIISNTGKKTGTITVKVAPYPQQTGQVSQPQHSGQVGQLPYLGPVGEYVVNRFGRPGKQATVSIKVAPYPQQIGQVGHPQHFGQVGQHTTSGYQDWYPPVAHHFTRPVPVSHTENPATTSGAHHDEAAYLASFNLSSPAEEVLAGGHTENPAAMSFAYHAEASYAASFDYSSSVEEVLAGGHTENHVAMSDANLAEAAYLASFNLSSPVEEVSAGGHDEPNDQTAGTADGSSSVAAQNATNDNLKSANEATETEAAEAEAVEIEAAETEVAETEAAETEAARAEAEPTVAVKTADGGESVAAQDATNNNLKSANEAAETEAAKTEAEPTVAVKTAGSGESVVAQDPTDDNLKSVNEVSETQAEDIVTVETANDGEPVVIQDTGAGHPHHTEQTATEPGNRRKSKSQRRREKSRANEAEKQAQEEAKKAAEAGAKDQAQAKNGEESGVAQDENPEETQPAEQATNEADPSQPSKSKKQRDKRKRQDERKKEEDERRKAEEAEKERKKKEDRGFGSRIFGFDNMLVEAEAQDQAEATEPETAQNANPEDTQSAEQAANEAGPSQPSKSKKQRDKKKRQDESKKAAEVEERKQEGALASCRKLHQNDADFLNGTQPLPNSPIDTRPFRHQ
ncbi:hypothetical protein PG995_015618 [Apiospora arundinis]